LVAEGRVELPALGL